MFKRIVYILLALVLVVFTGCFESKEKRYNRLFEEKKYIELYEEVSSDKEWSNWFDTKMCNNKNYKEYYTILENTNKVERKRLITKIINDNKYNDLMTYLNWSKDGDYFIDEMVQKGKFVEIPFLIFDRINKQKVKDYSFVVQYVFKALDYYVQEFRFNERSKAINNVYDIYVSYNYSKYRGEFLEESDLYKKYAQQIIRDSVDTLYVDSIDMVIMTRDKKCYSITCRKGYSNKYKDGITNTNYMDGFYNKISSGSSYLGYTYYASLKQVIGDKMIISGIDFYRENYIG